MTETASMQEALIHLMATMCVADRGMDALELRTIRSQVELLPVFADFAIDDLPRVVDAAVGILHHQDGIDRVVKNVALHVPAKLHETAYALAVEVASADANATQEELRLLEIIREGLDLEPLATTAIEHSARVRYRRG